MSKTHELGNYVDCKGDVRLSESKILETADKFTVLSGVGEKVVISYR